MTGITACTAQHFFFFFLPLVCIMLRISQAFDVPTECFALLPIAQCIGNTAHLCPVDMSGKSMRCFCQVKIINLKAYKRNSKSLLSKKHDLRYYSCL